MSPIKRTRLIFLLIFIFSAALRIALATVNREANDNHIQVVALMLQNHRLVERDECWECFQPKLYYALVILLIRAGDLYPGYLSDGMIVAAQMLNAALGILLIGVVWLFLEALPVPNDLLKISAFALTAFNPKMIGTNAQASNDTLAILLSVLAIYSALLFLRREKTVYLVACIVYIALGLVTKTNALVTTSAIMLSLLVKTYTLRQRWMTLATTGFLLSILFLAAINPLGQYQVNYQKYGSPVTMNRGIHAHRPPFIFEKTYIERPGIVSIADGYFTFKYFDLLKHPRLTNGVTDYPAHRTSFWTLLFAHGHSVHFDNWPPTWAASGADDFPLTRAILLLALFPSLMILLGAGMSLWEFLSALLKRSADALREMDYGLLAVSFWSYIAFLILYSMLYRDFSLIKTIYAYPALLSFVFFFIQAGKTFAAKKWFNIPLALITAVLVLLYIIDITSMTVQLYSVLHETQRSSDFSRLLTCTIKIVTTFS
jgi:hypothetical protein